MSHEIKWVETSIFTKWNRLELKISESLVKLNAFGGCYFFLDIQRWIDCVVNVFIIVGHSQNSLKATEILDVQKYICAFYQNK